jgi:hypothetical protein
MFAPLRRPSAPLGKPGLVLRLSGRAAQASSQVGGAERAQALQPVQRIFAADGGVGVCISRDGA